MTTTAPERSYSAYQLICYCQECQFFIPPVWNYHSAIYARRVSEEGICPECGSKLVADVGRFYREVKVKRFMGLSWRSESSARGFELRRKS